MKILIPEVGLLIIAGLSLKKSKSFFGDSLPAPGDNSNALLNEAACFL
jgi:hypothetical protein